LILIRRKTRNFIAQYVHRRLEQSYSPLNQRPRIANTSRPTATPRPLRAGVRATLFDLGNKQASLKNQRNCSDAKKQSAQPAPTAKLGLVR
jgi:hypothetical protein